MVEEQSRVEDKGSVDCPIDRPRTDVHIEKKGVKVVDRLEEAASEDTRSTARSTNQGVVVHSAQLAVAR